MTHKYFIWGVSYLILVITVNAEFSLSDLELPKYEVVSKGKNYEVRDYEAAKWACHDLEKDSYVSRFMETQYYELFQYISGENDKKQTIPITAPVTMKVITNPGGKTKIQMCFFIPKEFQPNPPKPTNKKIYVEERPAITVFSRKFAGYVSRHSEFEEEADKLRNDLMVEDKKADFSFFYAVNYDPPVRPNERQNEVWFVQE